MRTEKYKEFFTKDYMMGPNSIRLLNEMMTYVPEQALSGRILDLGCRDGAAFPIQSPLRP